ncbi:MAG: phage baseplate assembly protein V [Lachnospiraceae bacterium]|nr:phage baseplate assembly protein V [Lachnospiraceae bacterium]
MAIFDIIEDVSKKQIEKTDTGDSRIMGVMLGQVVKNYDQNMPGRVSVILLSREEVKDDDGGGQGAAAGDKSQEAGASRLLWARVIQQSSGGIYGHYFIPEPGDLVLVTFEQGNIERPYIVGCIPKINDKILTGSFHEKNQYKKIVTKNGNAVIFEDIAGSEGDGNDNAGDKDKITIETALQKHHLLFDNEKNMIELSDKDKKNVIRMSTAEDKGHIEITAAKKLTIKVGDNISLTMNGETGAVTLKAKKLTMESDEGTSIKSQSRMEIQGANATMTGSSMLKLSSDGPVQVGGTPIKLG